MKADLHLHSDCSDGKLPPMEVLRAAEAAGLDLIALTDHDCMHGVPQLLGASDRVRVIPGVELSLRDMHDLHLLCYGTGRDTPLQQKVDELSEARAGRALAILDKFRALGMPLDAEQVIAQARYSVGRLHIARAVVEAGYVSSVPEVFRRYLSDDGPCYVEGKRMTMAEALPLALESGFIPVLAHPMELGVSVTSLPALLTKWKSMGLCGMEAYHPSAGHRDGQLDRMARSMGLLVTGGSDFHEKRDAQHGMPGCMCARWQHMQEDIDRLLSRLDG